MNELEAPSQRSPQAGFDHHSKLRGAESPSAHHTHQLMYKAGKGRRQTGGGTTGVTDRPELAATSETMETAAKWLWVSAGIT